MDKSDFRGFRERMAVLGEIVGVEVGDKKLKIYWDILSRFPAEKVFAGFDRLMLQPKLLKFPVPGDIVNPGSGADLDAEAQAAAVAAWEKMMIAVSRAGRYRSVKFDDPLIMATVRHHGGWTEFCDLPNRELKFFRPQWERTYKALFRERKNGRAIGAPAYLIGIEELELRRHGEDGAVPEPVAICGPQQALPLECGGR